MRTIIVLRCLGVLLLVAAGLKAYGLAVDPVGSLGWFSSSWFQFGLIEVEILLGLWLLAGSHPRAGWLTAFGLFSVFAFVSLYQGLIGQASCGCFGKLELSPWYAFGIDVLALSSLLVCRPVSILPKNRFVSSNVGGSIAGWLLCAGAVFLLFTGLAYAFFGSPDDAVAYFRGERLSIRPNVVGVGNGVTGETRQVEIELINRTDRQIRIVGGTSDCSCVTTENLPVTLSAAETARITLTVRFTGQPGLFTRTAQLFTDDGQVPKVRFRLAGRSIRPSTGDVLEVADDIVPIHAE